MRAVRHAFFALALCTAAVPASAQDLPPDLSQIQERARNLARQARAQVQRQLRIEQQEQAARDRQRAARERRAQAEEQRGPEYTDTFTRTVRLSRTGTFDLSNVSGSVTITGGGGDEVKIDAVKRVRSLDETEAKAALQAIGIEVNERSGLVEVRTDLPPRRNWSGGVDYTVALPQGVNVAIRTVNGDLRITNVRGELRAQTVNGNVVASGVGRVRTLKTVSGDVQLNDAQGDDITLATVSGNVTARGIKGRSLDLDAVSGDLRFLDVDFERVNLRTVSGDIEYSGRLARSGRYDLQSHSGDIRIAPLGNTGFDLDANTFRGDIRSDFQLGGAPAAAAVTRPGRNQMLRGTFGDAGAILTLRSFNGNVVIVRQ